MAPQGRVAMAAPLRCVLGFETGDTLVVRFKDGRLVSEKRETIKCRLKTRFARLPKETSLASELLAERREEAKRLAGRSAL